MKYLYLEICGMVCASCSSEIKTALQVLPGVTEVVVDHHEGNAIVAYDPRLQNQLKVFEIIGELGYQTKSNAFLSP